MNEIYAMNHTSPALRCSYVRLTLFLFFFLSKAQKQGIDIFEAIEGGPLKKEEPIYVLYNLYAYIV